MRMIPDTPYRTDSSAERRTFDRLRGAFNGPGEDLTAYHSLNLTRHAYKRFGEIDFVLCGRDGLFVLEVKGGGVSCENGVWTYTNREGARTLNREGPFRQAESALHGLVGDLEDHLPSAVVSSLTIGFGVIFPDCEWRVESAEWDPHTLCDARKFRDLEGWLRRLFRYWRAKAAHPTFADPASLRAVRKYLRPNFETATPLYVLTDRAAEEAARLTEDQMDWVDTIAANRRVLCSGGAGTGKTFLAMELARRWAAAGRQVLLACKSPWLRRYLETRFAIPGLTIAVVDNVRTAAQRAGRERFDALIVDEGQDLFDLESLDLLDRYLLGGLSEGSWCIFHDTNNQAGLVGRTDSEAYRYLLELAPARVSLRTNCRNTLAILERVQEATGADMGVRGIGAGPKVRWHRARSPEESAQLLAEEIGSLLDDGGLSPGHVTVLSPHPFPESSAALLPEPMGRMLQILDEYSLRSFPPSRPSFAQIASFKGLENEAVIVIDLPEPYREAEDLLPLHYVAMSRPRAVLSLITRPADCHRDHAGAVRGGSV